jgi:MFS family permease
VVVVSDRSLLFHRDFRLLLLGQTTSQFGAQISGVAIPLLAVLTLHASSLQLGFLNASATIAFALIGLPAGAWLDRWRRRPILVTADIVRFVLLAAIPILAFLGALSIVQLLVISLLVGTARVFFDVGYQSYIPSVVGATRVLSGNSAMETARASGQVVGPGIGGALVSLIGAANVVFVQAIAFAVSAASLIAIRGREPRPEPQQHSASLWLQIREGLAFVFHNRLLRATAVASAASNFAFAISSAVTFIFLSRTLHMPAFVIGLVIAGGSLTVIAGAALTPFLSRKIGSARIIWLSLAVTGPFSLLVPLAQPGWGIVLVAASIAVGELGQIIYSVTNVSIRQRLTPSTLLGRVNATMRFLIMASFPLGAVLGGVLGTVIGLRGALWITGAILVLTPIPLYRSMRGARNIEDMELPQPA